MSQAQKGFLLGVAIGVVIHYGYVQAQANRGA